MTGSVAIVEILKLKSDGLSNAEIARAIGVSRQAVHQRIKANQVKWHKRYLMDTKERI